jgi:hypothetical protein
VPALGAALARLLRDPQEQKLRGQALRERVVARFASSTLARRLLERVAGLGLVLAFLFLWTVHGTYEVERPRVAETLGVRA